MDLPILLDTYTKDRRIVADPAPASGSPPAASTECAGKFPVSCLKVTRKLDPLFSPVFFDNRLSDAPIEKIHCWLPVPRDLRCSQGRKVETEAEENVCEFSETALFPHAAHRELLPTLRALSTSVFQRMETCTSPARWTEHPLITATTSNGYTQWGKDGIGTENALRHTERLLYNIYNFSNPRDVYFLYYRMWTGK